MSSQTVYFTNPSVINNIISNTTTNSNGISAINDPKWLANNLWPAQNYSNFAYKNTSNVFETIEYFDNYALTGAYPTPIGVSTGGTLYSIKKFYPQTAINYNWVNPVDPCFSYNGDVWANASIYFRSLASNQPILSPSNDPQGDMFLNVVLDLATGSDTAVPETPGDYTTWITRLKQGCYFADGTEIKSVNIQAGVSRALTSFGFVYAFGLLPNYLLYLDGASDYVDNGTFFSQELTGTSDPICYFYQPLASVECVDDYTIRWHLNQSVPNWNLILTISTIIPVIVDTTPVGDSPTGPWVPENYDSGNFWKNPTCAGRNNCSAPYMYTGINVLSTGTNFYFSELTETYGSQEFEDIFVIECSRNPYWNKENDTAREAYPDNICIKYASDVYSYSGPAGTGYKNCSLAIDDIWMQDIYNSTGPSTTTFYSRYQNGDIAESFTATGTFGPASLSPGLGVAPDVANKVWLINQQKPVPGYENDVRAISSIFNSLFSFSVGEYIDGNGIFGDPGTIYSATGAGRYTNVRRAVQAALNRGQNALLNNGITMIEGYPKAKSFYSGYMLNNMVPTCFPESRDNQVEINGWKETDQFLPPSDLATAVQFCQIAEAEGITFPQRLNYLLGGDPTTTTTQNLVEWWNNTFFTGPLGQYFTGTVSVVDNIYNVVGFPNVMLPNYDVVRRNWASDYNNAQGILAPELANTGYTGGFGIYNVGAVNDPIIDNLLNTLDAYIAAGNTTGANETCKAIEIRQLDQAYYIPQNVPGEVNLKGVGLNNLVYIPSAGGSSSSCPLGSIWISPEYQ